MQKYLYILIIVALATASVSAVSAQSAPIQTFITWKASSFYPSYFEGKALPAAGNPVTVSAEAVRNGSLIDLSQTDLTWEVDSKYVASGRGLKTAAFTATKGLGDVHVVRVSGTYNSESVEGAIRIPVTAPSVTIDAPYPERIAGGGSITLRALPFFFNVKSIGDISFAWNIEGERRETGSENFITITSAVARSFPITLEAQNIGSGRGEAAATRGTFTINP